MPAMMSASGVIVAIAFIGLSALMNWSYGVSRGTGELDRWLLGAVSVSADLYKAIGLFFVGWAIKHRRLWVWCLGVFAWLLAVVYGFSSAFGYASLARADATRRGDDRGSLYRSLKAELTRKEQRRAEIGAVGASLVAEGRLVELKAQSLWRETRECRALRSTVHTDFCGSVRRAQQERALSDEAEALDREIAGLRERLARVSEMNVTGDPQSDLIAQLTGIELRKIAFALVVLLVVLVELMSGAGLYIALGHGEPLVWRRTAEASEGLAVGDVARFALVATREEPGTETDVDVLFAAYATWCRMTGQAALARTMFVERWQALATEVGWQIDGGRVSDLVPVQEFRGA